MINYVNNLVDNYIVKVNLHIYQGKLLQGGDIGSNIRPRAYIGSNIAPLHIGFQFCWYAPMSISACLYNNVNITPLASCHWKICRPRATLCRPRPPWCRPRPSSSALRASGGIRGASGDIMFCPWAAYFPMSLCQGCNIVTICLLPRKNHGLSNFLCFTLHSFLGRHSTRSYFFRRSEEWYITTIWDLADTSLKEAILPSVWPPGLFEMHTVAIDAIQRKQYRDEIYSLQKLLSRTQAGPGLTVEQEQDEISPNHVQRINLISVYNHRSY